jgi:hypothetical protein
MFEPNVRFTFSGDGRTYDSAIQGSRLQIRDVETGDFIAGNGALREAATSVIVHAELLRSIRDDRWPFIDAITNANNTFLDARETSSSFNVDGFLDALGDTTSSVLGSTAGSVVGAGLMLAAGIYAPVTATVALTIAGGALALDAIGTAIASGTEEGREASIQGYLGQLGDIFVIQALRFQEAYVSNDSAPIFDVGDSDAFISDVAAGVRANYGAEALNTLIKDLRDNTFDEPFFQSQQFWASFNQSFVGGSADPLIPGASLAIELGTTKNEILDAINGVNSVTPEELNNTITRYIDTAVAEMRDQVDEITQQSLQITTEGGTEDEDTIVAGTGDVNVEGGGGDDVLRAGSGNAIFEGEQGADTYVFDSDDWQGDDVVRDSGGRLQFEQTGAFFEFSRSGNDLILSDDDSSVAVDGFFETNETKTQTSPSDVKNYSFEFATVNGGSVWSVERVLDKVPDSHFKTPPPPPPQNEPDERTYGPVTIGEDGSQRVAPGEVVALSDLLQFSGGSAQYFDSFYIEDDGDKETGFFVDEDGSAIERSSDIYLFATQSGYDTIVSRAQTDDRWWEWALDNEGRFNEIGFKGGYGSEDFTIIPQFLPDNPDGTYQYGGPRYGGFLEVDIESTQEKNKPPNVSASNASVTSADTVFVPDVNVFDPDGQAVTYEFRLDDASGAKVGRSGVPFVLGEWAKVSPAAVERGFSISNSERDDVVDFSVRGSDGEEYSNVAAFSVLIGNSAPQAGNVQFQYETDDASARIPVSSVTSASRDVDGDPLNIVGLNSTGSSVSRDGESIVVSGLSGEVGEVGGGFVAIVSDGNDTAEVTVSFVGVEPPNKAPAALNDTVRTDEDMAVTISVLANDSDEDGDTLTVAQVGTPEHGSVSDNGGETVTYTPDPGFTGTDTFTYTVSDGNGETDSADVTVEVGDLGVAEASITIEDIKTEPVAGSKAYKYTVETNFTLGGRSDAEINLGFNTEQIDAYRLSDKEVVNTNGSITFEGTVTPAEYSNGAFEVYANVSEYPRPDTWTPLDSDIAEFPLEEIEDGPPAARSDNTTTVSGEPVRIDVLENDNDPDGDDLNIRDVGDPANGQVSITNDNRVRYTPDAGFTGTDTFIYTVSDGNDGTDTATVSVTVDSHDDGPVTGDYRVTEQKFPVGEDYEAVIDDVFGEQAFLADWDTISARYAAEGGEFLRDAGLTPRDEDGVNGGAITQDGERFWSGDRHYSFTWGEVGSYYLSHDNVSYEGVPLHLGSWYSPKYIFANTSQVAARDNRPPEARDDSASTPRDTAMVFQPAELISNDSDPDGDTLVIASVENASNGSVALKDDGTVRFTPDADFAGAAGFDYTVGDGNGGTAMASVNVSVDPNSTGASVPQARVFPVKYGDFTVYDAAELFGRGGDGESVLIAAGARNVALDGNVDRIDLPVNQAASTFQVVEGQLEISVGGEVMVRITGGLNQEVEMRFADGDATLQQIGAATFDLSGGQESRTTIDDMATTPSLTLGSNASATAGGTPPQGLEGQKANVFLHGQASFTISDSANVFGRGGSDETVRLTGNAENVILDGNIERIELPDVLSATKFEVGDGQLIISVNGTPITSFAGGLNQDVALQFGDGEGTLSQTGAASFTLTGPGGQAQVGTTPITPDIGLGGPVAVGSSDDGRTFDAASSDTTFDFADGTYGVTIQGFAAGDQLDFADVGGGAAATLNALADTDQTDGRQEVTVTDPNDGSTTTVTLVGLTSAQDSTVFNQSSFESEFGSGSLVL